MLGSLVSILHPTVAEKGLVEILDLTILGLPSALEDLGSRGANNLAPSTRFSCNYQEQRNNVLKWMNKEGQTPKFWMLGVQKYALGGHLL